MTGKIAGKRIGKKFGKRQEKGGAAAKLVVVQGVCITCPKSVSP